MKFIGSALVLVFVLASQEPSKSVNSAYPSISPSPPQLMTRDAEISNSRSAALKSSSGDADTHAQARMKGAIPPGQSDAKKEANRMITYREPMINYYVRDPEQLAAFYREHFGFIETFRTPQTGPAIHIEVTLGNFVVGLARIEAVRSMHHLEIDPGKPRGEIAIWTDDVDAAIGELRRHGVRVLSEPHNFLVDPPLRAAWVQDPEGNPIQIVCFRPAGVRPTPGATCC